jgi:hypothetical protein
VLDDNPPLICAECDCVSDPVAAGWRGYYDTEDNLVLFCRECAERAFGIKTA